MAKNDQSSVPAIVALGKVAEEIDLLLDEEWTAHLNRRTGELFTVTADDQYAIENADDPDLPDWQREHLPKVREVLESADWLDLPSKFDIHEYDIMQRFCLELDDDGQREALLDAIRGRGAFRRFKGLVDRYGIRDRWYDFRAREMESIVADWLDAQGIPYRK